MKLSVKHNRRHMKMTRLDQKTIRGMMDCLVHVEHKWRRAITTLTQFSLEVLTEKCCTDLYGRCCAGTTQIRVRVCCHFFFLSTVYNDPEPDGHFMREQNRALLYFWAYLSQSCLLSYTAKEQSTESLHSRQLPCLVMCVFTLVSRGRDF